MTVKELIKQLSQYPDETEVNISYKSQVDRFEWEEHEGEIESVNVEYWVNQGKFFIHLRTYEEEE